MYCFYTYRRTLQILKEREDSLQKPYHGFDTLDNKNNYIKTKYTNIHKEVGILYHIFIHTSRLLFILKPSSCDDKKFEKNVHTKRLSDLFEICYMNGVYDNYEDNEKQYEGDDFQDIFEKYHYTRFPDKLEEIPSFIESLNNMELIRVMSLISWHLRRDKPQLDNFTSMDEENNMYDINRLIEMNEDIIGYMENKELTNEKKRLLNLCLDFYINHKMEDRVLSLFEHYPIDIFIFTEKHFKIIYQQSLYKILYELICNQYFDIYDLEDLIKESKSTSTYRYSTTQQSIIDRKVEKDYEKDVIFGLPEENDDEKEKKKYINIFIQNIEFLDLVQSKNNEENHEDVIQYLQERPNFVFKIPVHYMYYLIKNPDILLYMLKHNQIHRRVELFIYIFKYSTPELFSNIKIEYAYITSLNFYCKFDWDLYETIDDGSIPNEESYNKKTACFTKEKKEIRYKKVQSLIPGFLSLQMKTLIMNYLCKNK